MSDPPQDLPGGSSRRRRDTVELRGLRARGRHGVLDAERALGQVFIADVVLEVDTRAAATSDDLADAVDYSVVAADVVAVLAGPAVALVETLAQRVAQVCLARPGVGAVDVAVHKPQAPVGVAFDDVVVRVRRVRGELLDLRPERPVGVVLGLGANAGDPAAALMRAVATLRATPELTDVRASSVVATPPVGGPPQPDYLNAVIRASTRASPRAILRTLQQLEADAGRDRSREQRWGPRPLDVDLLAYGQLVDADDDLAVPHPRAAGRAFVLVPWAQVAPDDVLPGQGRVADALGALCATDREQVEGVRARPDIELGPPLESAGMEPEGLEPAGRESLESSGVST